MPEDKMIHELPIAPRISSSDLFETEIPDELSETGYKTGNHALSVIESHVLGTEQYNSQLPNFPQGSRSIFSALEYARQSGGGGGASVIQKTLAEYQALPTADKMNGSIYKITDKALIYCLDEEFHAMKELTAAEYAALSNDEKNNGTLYVITDEETTAADIPYTSGVSVADKLATIPTFTTHQDVITFSTAKTGYKDVAIPIGKIIPQGALLAADTAVPLVLTLQDLGNNTTRLRATSSTGIAYTSNVLLIYLTID